MRSKGKKETQKNHIDLFCGNVNSHTNKMIHDFGMELTK